MLGLWGYISIVLYWDLRLDTGFKNFTQICWVFRRPWAICCSSVFETKGKARDFVQLVLCFFTIYHKPHNVVTFHQQI